MSAKGDEDVTIENLVTFQIGELSEDGIALVLAYAANQEKLSRGEMESFAIGMTRAKASELGNALLEIAGKARSSEAPKQTQH